MQIPVLSSDKNIKGKRIFLRVDWNVPLTGKFADEDLLKLERSAETIRDLHRRGAVVLIATHLGRPKRRDMSLSTRRLLHLVEIRYNLDLKFLGDELDTAPGLRSAKKKIQNAKPGALFLLENVRFYQGEEKNDPMLAKAYASLADIFVNDAFASCHREHASVVGAAKLLPRFAGPTLFQEIQALHRLLEKPKHPFLAFVGGVKISTKIGVINALLKTASKVFIGGAMANAFFAVKKYEIGKSYVEKDGLPLARKLLKEPHLVLPIDVVVAKKIEPGAPVRVTDLKGIKKNEAIGDIGPKTVTDWALQIREAKTLVWNGPFGVTEIPSFSHSSLILARAMAAKSRGPAYGVVGGGDSLPVALKTGMSEWYDHLSTGGGAMLEFIANHGRLPGIEALAKIKRQASRSGKKSR